MADPLRIIDANANRAREALRVMEEAARFLLDDAALSADLKQLRHDLAETLSGVDGLELHRDTPGDVGTSISTEAEGARGSAFDVAAAAGKRLGEALRAIEEYLKPTAHGVLAPRVEQLRYRGYEAERRLHAALGTGRAQQWRLCLLLTESLCHHPWREVLDGAIAGGVDCVQVREKDLDAGPLMRRVKEVIDIARPRGAAVIVNDRPDVALAAGADGVHLGQHDLPLTDARRLVGRRLLIGISTANLDQAHAAVRGGADYCGLGPMFPTATVDNKPDIAGPAYLRAFRGAHPHTPHLAIGGVTPANAEQLYAAGARGLAASSAICNDPDPQDAARQLLPR